MSQAKVESALISWYRKLASAKIVAVCCLLYLVNQAIILSILSPLGHDPLVLQLTFSEAAFADVLEGWSAGNLHTYRIHFVPDYLHGLIYAVFLSSLIAYLTSRSGRDPTRSRQAFFLLPYLACLCDTIENSLHLHLVSNEVAISGELVATSALFTWMKWTLVGLSLGAIVFYIVKNRGLRRLRDEET